LYINDIGSFTTELLNNNLFIYVFYIFLLLLITLFLIIFVSRIRYKKTNSLLSEKNKEIVSQREKIKKQLKKKQSRLIVIVIRLDS